MLTISATEAFKFIGPPEGYLAIAQAVIYLSLCEKSNAVYKAYGAVSRDVKNLPEYPVPCISGTRPRSSWGSWDMERVTSIP